MKVVSKLFDKILIRLGRSPNLIFFALLVLLSCRQQSASEVSILWEDDKAVGLIVPHSLISAADQAVSKEKLTLRRAGSSTDILGKVTTEGKSLLFTPLINLSAGATYTLSLAGKLLSPITIPVNRELVRPQLLAIYPSSDTVPENLLKLYFHFSAPMREGSSLSHISLIDDLNDTLQHIFLDLQPELWNQDRTILTVWLDPGRIKRDLIPNQKMGNPLQVGRQYRLFIASNWANAAGTALRSSYQKKLVVSSRDSLTPDPQNWRITLPLSGSRQTLTLKSGEPLDYYLLKETITVIKDGQIVPGLIMISQKESVIEFIPHANWKPGRYLVKVDVSLEDLAGNNVKRPFDRDITTTKEISIGNFATRTFTLSDRRP